jgi:hypothetical protein
MTGPTEALEAYASMRAARVIDVAITRRNTPLELLIRVE